MINENTQNVYGEGSRVVNIPFTTQNYPTHSSSLVDSFSAIPTNGDEPYDLIKFHKGETWEWGKIWTCSTSIIINCFEYGNRFFSIAYIYSWELIHD